MTTENPYRAPTAAIQDPIPEVPKKILTQIKRAWVAALFSAGITLLVTVIAMSGTEILGFSAWELFDVALILGLAFGIYKRSRTCAVVMLGYFILSKILLMAQTGGPTGIPMALIFGYYFWQGVAGTFAYHKFLEGRPAPVTRAV